LPSLDRVHDRQRLVPSLRRGPRVDALGRLGARLTIRPRPEGGDELVPQPDVLDLLTRVLLVTGLPGGVRERDDGVPVLACVVCKLVARQLTTTPALVERMLEHVPALAGGVDPLDQLHSGSPSVDDSRC
jgi:hypothetical protein